MLPLKANSPVSVFGRCQYDTFSGGYGTGKGPNTDYPPITIMQGFDNNPALAYSGELAVCDLNGDGKIDVCDLVKLDNMLEK